MRAFFRARPTPVRWAIITLFALTQFAVLMWLWNGMGGSLGPLNSGYELTAQLTDGHSLQHAADVRMHGVTIGRVREIGLTEDHKMAVRFQIDDDSVLPMREGMQILPRVKSLLDDVYLEITPGPANAPPLESGATLPLAASQDRVQLDEVLADLGPEARDDAETLLADLGDGFDGRAEDLNELATALGPLGEDGSALFTTLVETQEHLEGVIDNTSVLLEVLDERDAQLVSLVDDAGVLAAATSRQHAALNRTMEALPGTIEQLQDSSPSIRTLSDELEPVARDLSAAAPDLNQVLADLGPTAEDLSAALPDADRVLEAVPPLLDTFPETADSVQDLLGPAPEVLSHLNPSVRYLAPYAPEVASLFSTWSDAFSSRDENGHYLRLVLMFGAESVTEMPVKTIRSNAYPKPGQLGNWTEFDGEFPVIEPDPIPGRADPEEDDQAGEPKAGNVVDRMLREFQEAIQPAYDNRYALSDGADDGEPDEPRQELDARSARASGDATNRGAWLGAAILLLAVTLRACGEHRYRSRRRQMASTGGDPLGRQDQE